jgi:hypothetical protein
VNGEAIAGRPPLLLGESDWINNWWIGPLHRRNAFFSAETPQEGFPWPHWSPTNVKWAFRSLWHMVSYAMGWTIRVCCFCLCRVKMIVIDFHFVRFCSNCDGKSYVAREIQSSITRGWLGYSSQNINMTVDFVLSIRIGEIRAI